MVGLEDFTSVASIPRITNSIRSQVLTLGLYHALLPTVIVSLSISTIVTTRYAFNASPKKQTPR